MADWLAIKAEYISTGISLRDLAEKHGVSFSSLGKKAMRERWKDERTETGNKVATKVKQKIVSVSVAKEVDRLTRLLGVGDLLTDKLEQSAKQLGAYTILKRKCEHVIEDDNGDRRLVEDTEEIAVPCEAVVNAADAKRIASALKDLHEIAKGNEQGDGKDTEDLTPLASLLGEPHE